MAKPGEPLNVGILIFDDVEVLDFCGPFEVFSVTAQINAVAGDPPPFAVFTIAQSERIVKARGGLLVQPHFTLENHPPLDILVVPGGWGTRREVDNPVILNWLRKATVETQLTTSVCTGAFLLAKIGLLDGKAATTHWASIDRMRETFPQVEVVDNMRWADMDTVITSAGISAGIDMCLFVVSRLLGRAVAENTARQMEYTWHERGM